MHTCVIAASTHKPGRWRFSGTGCSSSRRRRAREKHTGVALRRRSPLQVFARKLAPYRGLPRQKKAFGYA